ncbi:peptidoglycan-binding protein [Streptomyces sp. NPDC000658]|uniref:peptidoglycan-binding domain-containing protein n=1 Tax=Streptomyces sp. NPDC000658 TaxID=3154266 RepID=UPI003326DD3E
MIDPTGRQEPAGRQGLPCPECGALRAADNTPSCACAQRASEALRDTRTAEAAAAEDFDPLRIRPYVELDDSPPGTGVGAAPGAAPDTGAAPGPGQTPAPAPAPANGTESGYGYGAASDYGYGYGYGTGHDSGHGPGHDTGSGSDSGHGPGHDTGSGSDSGSGHDYGHDHGQAAAGSPEAGHGAGGRADSEGGARFGTGTGAGAVSPADLTMPLRAVPGDTTVPLHTVAHGGPAPDATTALPAPLTAHASEPDAGDLSLFETVDVGAAHPDGEEPRDSRRRRTLLIATAAAAVGVVAAAGFATGLFSYEKPTRDRAVPEDVRAAVPDTSTEPASDSPSASRSASPSPSEASPSPSESASPSPSPSASSASPSASPSAEPPRPTPTARASASLAPGNGAAGGQEDPVDAVVLRRGDKGAEVTELQLRLRQLYLYNGQTDGTFSSEVEDAVRNYQWSRGTTSDGLGVYGPATRTALESETKEP